MRLSLPVFLLVVLLLSGCGGLSPMLGPPDEDVAGRYLVVYVPDEMDVWGREEFLGVLATPDSAFADRFRSDLQDALASRVRFERVDVRRTPEGLTRQRFRVVERRHETVWILDLPPPGTTLAEEGTTPDYVVFLNALEFQRGAADIEFGGAPGGPRVIPGRAGGPPTVIHEPSTGPVVRPNFAAEWRTRVALWDNGSGSPVATAAASGDGTLEEVTGGLLAGARPTRQTWTDSVSGLAESIADELRLERSSAPAD